jgi:hypothetical protein
MQRRAFLGVCAAGVTGGCVGRLLSFGPRAAVYHVTRVDSSASSPTPPSSPALAASIDVVDDRVTADSSGVLDIAVTNVSETSHRVSASPVPPFGPLSAETIAGDDRFLLWFDEYEPCLNVSAGSACLRAVTVRLAAGERVSGRYEILHQSTEIHPSFTRPPEMGAYRVVRGVPRWYTEPFFKVGFALEPI